MRRGFLIVVLSLGTLLGFASGFAHLYGYHHQGFWGACGCPHSVGATQQSGGAPSEGSPKPPSP